MEKVMKMEEGLMDENEDVIASFGFWIWMKITIMFM
jgi:hypothetical protein